MFTLSQWAEATYQNCIDPTIGRDAEETPEVHECTFCGDDFFQREGHLINNELKSCSTCCTKENIYKFYSELTDLTDYQIETIKIKDL